MSRPTTAAAALLAILATLLGLTAARPLAVVATHTADSDPRRVAGDLGRLFHDVAATVGPAVVHVETAPADGGSRESGSGVLLALDGRSVLVTNRHVVAGCAAAEIAVSLADGRILHPDSVREDVQTDLAVMTFAAELPAARIGDSRAVTVGQWVVVLGSPFGMRHSVGHGIVSGTHRRRVGLPADLRIGDFLQTDAPINPGNSGGPLVDMDGAVIGINTAMASRTGSSSGVGFSIPTHLVVRVARDLLRHGRVRRGYLGVEFRDRFDHGQASDLGLRRLHGAAVAAVHPGSAAAVAGVRVGDVVLAFDEVAVEDDAHLTMLVAQTRVGRRTNLEVWRAHRSRRLSVRLGDWRDYRPPNTDDPTR